MASNPSAKVVIFFETYNINDLIEKCNLQEKKINEYEIRIKNALFSAIRMFHDFSFISGIAKFKSAIFQQVTESKKRLSRRFLFRQN